MSKRLSGKEKQVFKHATRFLTTFLGFLIICFVLIAFTGTHSWRPRLGIDLQGGTTVTLTPRTLSGVAPTKTQLTLAQNIIESRVNGRGISGAEVVVAGSNIQITIPGNDQGLARSLGVTAQMFIRPVTNVREVSSVPSATTSKSAPTAAQSKHNQTDRSRPVSTPVKPSPTTVSTVPNAAEKQSEQKQLAEGYTATQVEAIRKAKQERQSTNPAALNAVFSTYNCPREDPLRGNDDPSLPLVTCSADKKDVYELGPSIIRGQDIADASAGYSAGAWKIELSFKGAGERLWPQYTATHIGTLTAFTLDSQVLSAPRIESAIAGGTEISGSYTQNSAVSLANQLKYGGLPLSFDTGTAETISATLGIASLQAGLIAGAIGIIIVLIFACIYYRILGILVAISLALSLILVYVIFVLLGRMIGLTLDLPGIAGLIIGIGMTADSFVVYFERIKDEVRAGRSVKTAVSTAWPRAQRTILSGNSVSFIAAAVLYILAVGAVRGFAFTLGLTSILDLIIVYFVTHPIMELISIQRRFTDHPKILGLGAAMSVVQNQRKLSVQSGAKASPQSEHGSADSASRIDAEMVVSSAAKKGRAK